MNRLSGKSAVVIGATSGMGEAMVKLFAKEGAEVIFTGRRADKGSLIEREVQQAGGKAFFVQADSTKSEDIVTIFANATGKFGKIDILVNNAGIGTTGAIDSTSMDEYDKTMNINIRSYYEACSTVVPIMKKQGFGSIINTASIGGLKGLPNTTAYCVSKGAVRLLTKSMAVELASFGIRVNTLCPGTIDTEMLAGTSEEYRAALAAGVPAGKLGSSDDIAYGALYLASDESAYVTGLDLVIDGGLSV